MSFSGIGVISADLAGELLCRLKGLYRNKQQKKNKMLRGKKNDKKSKILNWQTKKPIGNTRFEIYQQYIARRNTKTQRSSGWHYRFTQLVCTLIIFSFLSFDTRRTNTVELHRDVRFKLLTGNYGAAISGWITPLLLFLKTDRQTQQIDVIRILPGDVTVARGESIDFSAIAYDREGNPINGVEFQWKLEDTGRGIRGRRIRDGKFKAYAPGQYTITAITNDRQEAQTTITVQENEALSTLRRIRAAEVAGDLEEVIRLIGNG